MDEGISRIARGLSRSLLAYGGIHVSVRDLPDAVYRALKKIGYGRRDIEVIYDTKYSVSAAFENNRALAYTIDLRTGRITDSQIGSWGGSNPWEDRSIDRGEAHPVPSGSVVIAGESGGRGNFLKTRKWLSMSSAASRAATGLIRSGGRGLENTAWKIPSLRA
jgi:hypothetical protein